MPKKTFGKSVSRRAFVRGALASGAAVAAGAASAQTLTQTTIENIINAPRRGTWDDQFDAQASRSAERVNSSVPILSTDTVNYVETAIASYQDIVLRGGWPVVPSGKRLKLGVDDPAVSTLRKRLIVSGDLAASTGTSTAFDSYVDGAVKRFQARHGLPADGVLGRYSYAALNVTAAVRLGQLETNLVRLRSMSGFLGDRYVVVNIPAAQIEAVEGERVVLRHTAVVGKISRQTPILNSKIHEVILNPYWTAPRSIIEKDIMPLMRKDPTYLTRNSIRLFDGRGNEVAPETIDWNAAEAPKLMFRQDPGKINAMSSTKINFHNPHAVYMHDTPQQSLFGKLLRFESSGCVRVQNVRDLSTWLLRDTSGWDRQTMEQVIASGVSTPVLLAEPVPVYFTYVTAWSTSDGVAQFRDDIYRRDGVEELALQ
ncbi:L,D-transpeptidase family protein [Hoeflea prorocentri]|uniref:L,D-transpeptidase family protein n=1 Tax=Hoeflea prorocentri TaxID=1922333 RepID=A0A9X3ULK0_9HYPH|nr:L,D-transpeptidase family protein [Hoeflea prorocentri]MCY6381246.1 L,D-transpeptidase family protein [Hoeflea prorocentri]MDA5399046.1 L,D-transpeptidase family protein [Hoeflea prorocentri]